MPRKNFYLSESDEEYYQLAKKYAGESLSSIIVQGLKAFVLRKQMEERSMEEVVRWIGDQESETGIKKGQNIKFVGKKIGDGEIVRSDNSKVVTVYELYYTRKGQYLLYKTINDYENKASYSEHKVFSNYNGLMTVRLPASIIEGVEKNMPDVVCEELDI